MKAFLLIALLGQTQAPTPTLPAPTRADVHFVAGWQNLRHPQPDEHYNEWLNSIAYGGAGVGWYWNDNLKTQVDVGVGTRADQYRSASTSSTASRRSNRLVSRFASRT